MAEILNKLTEIKQHVLGCFSFFNCGYENVRQLLNDVKGNDPTGNREYQHVIFDDRLGNYFWIEKISDVSLSRQNNGIMGKCEGAYHEATQRFSIFAMAKGIREESLFQCLAGCLANYGCKLTLSGGDYDSIAVLRRALSNTESLDSITSNLADWTIVRIDFSLKYDILPTNYGLDGCDCEPCPSCEIEITALSYNEDSITITYNANDALFVGLTLTENGNTLELDCKENTGQYYEELYATFIKGDGITATLQASNDNCATICGSASFITIVTNEEINRAGDDVAIPPPNNIPACDGILQYLFLYNEAVVGAVLNQNTGELTIPAQIIQVPREYIIYVTCNGLVIATVRYVLTNPPPQ